VPSAKLILGTMAVVVGVSCVTHASPLIPKPAGVFELSHRFEPARWRYRHYRRGGEDDERLYEILRQRNAAVQSTDPAIQMLRSSSRRGGRWVDPPPPR
jgi:hypothetical protein